MQRIKYLRLNFRVFKDGITEYNVFHNKAFITNDMKCLIYCPVFVCICYIKYLFCMTLRRV